MASFLVLLVGDKYDDHCMITELRSRSARCSMSWWVRAQTQEKKLEYIMWRRGGVCVFIFRVLLRQNLLL